MTSINPQGDEVCDPKDKQDDDRSGIPDAEIVVDTSVSSREHG